MMRHGGIGPYLWPSGGGKHDKDPDDTLPIKKPGRWPTGAGKSRPR